MTQTIGALLVVLASILALRAALRSGGLLPALSVRRSLRVVESAALGPRKSLHIVEVDGERLLLGSSDGSVSLLRRLRPGEPAKETLPAADADAPGPAGRPGRRLSPRLRLFGRAAAAALVLLAIPSGVAHAAPEAGALTLSLDGLTEPERLSSTLQILGLLTLVSVAPSILLMATCFTRVLVVLALLRQATGLPQLPPNQVLAGLALFTTLFVMAPVGERIHAEALSPYLAREIDETVAVERAVLPVREFLLRHTRESDLDLFVSLSRRPRPEGPEGVWLTSLLPAFMISELRTAFEIGFMIYLPFLVIDIVISSMLISMGMIVLPPILISLPFKLMLFVLVDGWNLVLSSLVKGLV